MLEFFDKNGFVVDWMEYYSDSIQSNWKSERTLIRIESSVSEVFGKEYGEEVVKRLKFCIIKR